MKPPRPMPVKGKSWIIARARDQTSRRPSNPPRPGLPTRASARRANPRRAASKIVTSELASRIQRPRCPARTSRTASPASRPSQAPRDWVKIRAAPPRDVKASAKARSRRDRLRQSKTNRPRASNRSGASRPAMTFGLTGLATCRVKRSYSPAEGRPSLRAFHWTTNGEARESSRPAASSASMILSMELRLCRNSIERMVLRRAMPASRRRSWGRV